MTAHPETHLSIAGPNGIDIFVEYRDRQFVVSVAPGINGVDVILETDDWSQVVSTVNFWRAPS